MIDCINWRGARHPKGYGLHSKRVVNGVGYYRAHRWIYALVFGVDPGELHVLHKCDNPSCINPSHLFLGTNADNVADRVAKGRSSNHNAKKTHCKRGHKLTKENTYDCDKGRRCKKCTREKERKRYYAKKAEASRAIA